MLQLPLGLSALGIPDPGFQWYFCAVQNEWNVRLTVAPCKTQNSRVPVPEANRWLAGLTAR